MGRTRKHVRRGKTTLSSNYLGSLWIIESVRQRWREKKKERKGKTELRKIKNKFELYGLFL